ncbi:LPS export ABC transporter periplasmic protein LptC [Flavobacteriales bacterium]|nr:LPS export ABC transporter periplasmic protein LptC [Flavobacteriales bacterium]
MRIILFFLVFVSCTNDPKAVQEFVSGKELPIEEIKEAELIQTENGNIKVKIVANTINRFQNSHPELIFSNNLVVTFYNDSSKVQSILKAENASIDEQKKIMIASGNVMLESYDDKKLETEELVWNEVSNKVYTEKKVKITTGKEVIFGEGFTSNPDFTEYSIVKIHGFLSFDSEK